MEACCNRAMDAALIRWVEEIDGRLQRCRLELRGRSLSLRASLPDQDDPSRRRQQRIALGLGLDPADLDRAEDLALQLDRQLRNHSFSWEQWQRLEPERSRVLTMEDLCQALEADFTAKYPTTPRTSATIWGKKYQSAINFFRRHPGPCTAQHLSTALLAMPSASSRLTYTSLARQALQRLPVDWAPDLLSQAGRGYTVRSLSERDIPDEELIEHCLDRIHLPHWRWMYGMCWLFGIRPSEIIGCELQQRDRRWILAVTQGKTGPREVWACPGEKLEQHGLQVVHRPPGTRYTVGKLAHDYLSSSRSDGHGRRRRASIPFGLYNLRHAYAIRLMAMGLPSEVGARLMGHSVEMHNTTYKRWVNQKHMAAMHARYAGQLD